MQNPTDPGEPGWAYDDDDDEVPDVRPTHDGDGGHFSPTDESSNVVGEPGNTAIVPRAETGTALSERIWHPEPVPPPRVDIELTRMPWPERTAEVIRYSALRAERWLSPNGALREWIRLNLRAGVVLLAFALLLVPPLTLVLKGGAEWSALLKSTLLNVSDTVMGMPPIVIALGALLIGGRFFQRRWLGRRRGRPAYREQDPYDN